jgi:hypothetical protein
MLHGNQLTRRTLCSGFPALEIQVQTVQKHDYDEALLTDLFKLGNQLVQEDYDHFCKHCRTNCLCHVFRSSNGDVMGFQFWRFDKLPQHDVGLIWGGKLRMHSSLRRRGLNLQSNVLAFEHAAQIVPAAQFHRVGLVNVLGWNSLTQGLSSYEPYPFSSFNHSESLVAMLESFCRENDFQFDQERGTVDVGQQFSSDTLGTADTRSFWERPAVQEFIQLNQQWENRDVFIAWEWDEANLRSMREFVDTKLRATGTYCI